MEFGHCHFDYESWTRGLVYYFYGLLGIIGSFLTRSLREPGGPCTKSMEVSESRMERVNKKTVSRRFKGICKIAIMIRKH